MICALYPGTMTGRRILLAMLCLLALAPSAAAETALVLWFQQFTTPVTLAPSRQVGT